MTRVLVVTLIALWAAWYLAFSVDMTIPGDIHPGDTSLWLGTEEVAPSP